MLQAYGVATLPGDVRASISGGDAEAALSYPDEVVGGLVAGRRDGEVTISLVAGPDHSAIEGTLNSFLHCCTTWRGSGGFWWSMPGCRPQGFLIPLAAFLVFGIDVGVLYLTWLTNRDWRWSRRG